MTFHDKSTMKRNEVMLNASRTSFEGVVTKVSLECTSDSDSDSVIRSPKREQVKFNEGTSVTDSVSEGSNEQGKKSKKVWASDVEPGWEKRRSDINIPNRSETDESLDGSSDSDDALKSRWLSKTAVLIVLAVATGLVAATIYNFLRSEEIQSYNTSFDNTANQIIEGLEHNSNNSLNFFESWSLHITSSTPKDAWPFVTIPNFEVQAQDAIRKTCARILSLCPMVTSEERVRWETYSVANQGWIQESLYAAHSSVNASEVTPFIFRPVSPPMPASDPIVPDTYLPIWQTSPILDNQKVINFDILNYTVVPSVYEQMMKTDGPVLTATINAQPDAELPPESFMAVPVYNSLREDRDIAALMIAMFRWEFYFLDVLPPGSPPLIVVVSNPCVDSISFKISGHNVTFLGIGDKHDSSYDDMETSYEFNSFAHVGDCVNTIHVFSTEAFYDEYVTSTPVVYTAVAVALFVITAMVFLLYDLSIKKQHKELLTSAKQSNAIVRSLFPESVRARIMGEHFRRGSLKHNCGTDSKRSKTSSDAHLSDCCDSATGKPIADLFPNATVMFADIAGFTAWASSREPSQVFTLLEGIYNSFDRIAAKNQIFKVETIGDCYVAAAGLPEARDDHAVVMTRFSRDCLMKFGKVVRDLEVTLGPDTAELGIRIGLHSGPVTAGVLRGDKSRFQLFGDTVNTAARMEGTGYINSIHLSQQTADMVIAGCDDLSLKPRDTLVEVKGKGKMQTYWLLYEGAQDPAELCATKRSSFFSCGSLEMSMHNLTLPSFSKQERLIDWNVDVLQGLLKKVVAMRTDSEKKPTKKIAKIHLTDEIEGAKMPIEEVKEILKIPSLTADYKRDPNSVELGSVVLAQLRDFVTCVASKYRKNHFHSFEHASHVTQSVIKLLARIVTPEDIDYDNLTYKKKENAVLHYYTYGITSDPLTQFAVAMAALIHDLDHKGVPNAQLVKERTKEAKKYKNKSVAEQNSVDIAWDLLMQPEYIDLRACIYNSKRELQRFRQLIVNAVMATDIVDKELGALRKKRWEMAFSSHTDETANESTDPLQASVEDMNRKATIVIEHLIQASDVSHTMQHWHVYIKWNERFFHECYQAYLDGRAENDPSDGWYKGEIGFFDFYIIPLAKKLKECGVFGVSSDEFLNYAESNRAEWEEKGEELVEQYIASYKEMVFGGFRNSTQNMAFPPQPSTNFEA